LSGVGRCRRPLGSCGRANMQVKLLDLTAQYINIRREIRKVIDDICDAQAFVLGPVVERFEKNLAAYCGTKHAIGVSSGTDALLCSLMALDIKAGDEVICPSFTFFATAGSIGRLGARPVFVDIDPETFNIDAGKIEAKITARTKAIIPVHLFGQVADTDRIMSIAQKRGLPVIEDAAQAIGAKRKGKKACSFGISGCLSFYPTKNLGGFGDGGAICTSDDAFAEKCRRLRVHGSSPTNVYDHKIVGGMFRLDAIQAGVLDVKLKYLDEWHEARRGHAAILDEMFAGTRVQAPIIEPSNYSVYNQYVIRVPNRDDVKAKLAAAGVGSAVYYPIPLHQQECFKYLGYKAGDLPESERACREVLALPVYPELTADQIRHVGKAVLEAVGK
jgi:dTDP-4-amino-4,6-dideoxygalactose transaminase